MHSYKSRFGNLLHICASFGSCDTFKKILEMSDLNVNSQSEEGSTPLHIAARLGRFEIVEYLLTRPDIDDTVRDIEGKTCLEVAKNKQIISIIECKQTNEVVNTGFLLLL